MNGPAYEFRFDCISHDRSLKYLGVLGKSLQMIGITRHINPVHGLIAQKHGIGAH